MAVTYNISGIPDGLPQGKYDTRTLGVRWVKTRDGKLDLVFELEYLGSWNEQDPSLLPFTKGQS